MKITNLDIVNFRNIKKLSLSFTTPVNIFYGENGQGKTNIVESIYVLSKTNSFRTSHSRELINYEFSQATLKALCKTNKRENKLQIVLNKENKGCYFNKIKLNKVSEYLGKLNAICFNPEDVSIFKDSPRERRHLIDSELSSLFPLYVKQLIVFLKVLDERNTLLKQRQNIDLVLLETIDEKLIECSYDLFIRRRWFLNNIQELASKILNQITKEDQRLKITYKTFLEADSKENYISKSKILYKSYYQRDIEKTFTGIGLHKDDFAVYLDEKEVNMYASQGQQRLVALVMKLAICEIVNKVNKESPIIILDDVFSELDKEKRKELLNYIVNKEQVFITCTDYKEIIKEQNDTTVFLVKDGSVIERSKL